MALESATYISDLNASNPTAGDSKSQGDDHLRLIKAVLKATFPSIAGAVNLTEADLNLLKSAHLTTNGSLKLPSGVILQWGVGTANQAGVATSFDATNPFTVGPFMALTCHIGTSPATPGALSYMTTAAAITLYSANPGGPYNAAFIAIGR